MPSTLKPRQAVDKGLRRIIQDQIHEALSEIDRSDSESIHSSEKLMKRIGDAALRLVRRCLPKRVYRRENISYRDISRKLTDLRDATVLLEALGPLQAADTERIGPDDISAIKKFLETDRQVVERRIVHEKAGVLPLKQSLEGRPTAPVRLVPGPYDALRSQVRLRAGHKQAYRAFIAADAEPTPDHLHEWRKKAKYGLYQLRILKKVWPAGIPRIGHQLKEVSRSLGDYRDLILLRKKLSDNAAAGKIGVPVDGMCESIDRRLTQLQEDSFRLGRVLYGHGLKELTRQAHSESR